MSRLPPPQLSSQASAILPLLRSAAARGLSANRTLESLRLSGLGYTRQTFLRDFSIIRGQSQKSERLQFIRKDRRPSRDSLNPALTKTARELAYIVEIDGFDPVTGNPQRRHLTISTSQDLTVGEIEELASEMLDDPEIYSPLEVSNVKLVDGVHNPGETIFR